MREAVATLIGGATLGGMTYGIDTEEPGHKSDFWYGIAWSIWIPIVFHILGHTDAWAWMAMATLSASTFAFGVVHRHTSLLDLMHGGVWGGFARLKHPRKRFLAVMLCIMFVIPVLGVLRSLLGTH